MKLGLFNLEGGVGGRRMCVFPGIRIINVDTYEFMYFYPFLYMLMYD